MMSDDITIDIDSWNAALDEASRLLQDKDLKWIDVVKTIRALKKRTPIPAPEKSGWYGYKNTYGDVIFYLDGEGQWWRHAGKGEVDKCEWSYIEQGLDVFTLRPLRPLA
jgi:hypothetical protein